MMRIWRAKEKVALACVALFAAMVIFRSERTLTSKEAGYVGTETCLSCHEGYDKQFMGTSKAVLFAKPAAAGEKHGCESCHGPAEKHLEDPETGVLRFSSASAEAKADACLKCHTSGNHKAWPVSQHALNGVSCTDCHSGHGQVSPTYKKAKKPEAMLINSQTELCSSCHTEKMAEISLPSRHPIKEGKISCSKCHDPHSSTDTAMDNVNKVCKECHQKNAGPFLYEHEPVAESCVACHTPHGSINQNLLKLRQPALCLQCHADTSVYHDTAASNFRKCSGCHTGLHGSSSSAGLFN